jgi:hypothetical protein
VEDWSIELESMTDYTYFFHKFENPSVTLLILLEEKLKDALFDNGGILLIHCKTTGPKEYMFTICFEYAKARFHLLTFHKSLENSKYESLLKEVDSQVDKKKWVNKDELTLGLKAIASRVRQLLISIAAITASNQHIIEQMKPTNLKKHITRVGGSMEYALLALKEKPQHLTGLYYEVEL